MVGQAEPGIPRLRFFGRGRREPVLKMGRDRYTMAVHRPVVAGWPILLSHDGDAHRVLVLPYRNRVAPKERGFLLGHQRPERIAG
jgi:hypothetical protein